MANTVKMNGVRPDIIKLKLVPFSLRDVAASWFESLPYGLLTVTPPTPFRPDWRIRTGFGVRNHILGLLKIFILFIYFFKPTTIYN